MPTEKVTGRGEYRNANYDGNFDNYVPMTSKIRNNVKIV